MSRSIKALSTIEPVTCMVCKKGGFTDTNPPVKYLGYTDHLECFAKDFVKKFIKKNPDIPETTLLSIDPWSLASINGLWAAIIKWENEEESPEQGIYHAGIVEAKSKKQLEESLQACLIKNSGLQILGIYSKGVKMPYETRVSVHIVETN